MSRQRAIGTRAESAVRDYLRAHGFPGADRQPLRGNRDQGDIAVTAGIVAEVKAGETAATASNAMIRHWIAQTERERQHAGADIAILVVRQRRRPPGQWHVWTTVDQLDILRGARTDERWGDSSTPVMLLLSDWSELARHLWGDEIGEIDD